MLSSPRAFPKIMKHLFLMVLACLVFPVYLFSQPEALASNNKPSPLNQNDKHGKKVGMWYTQQPERMGEEAYSEFGNYNAGRKTGIWYHMNNEGEITSIEQFRNNVLDGEVKYFEDGKLVCIGHYRGLNPDYAFDTIYVEHPVTGVEKQVVVATDRGTLKHGLWRFYDPQSGRLVREEDYQVDELIFRQEFALSNADSAYYAERNKRLPHNTKRIYQPPAGKRVHYYTN